VDAPTTTLIVVLIVAAALYWLGEARMKTITELRKRIGELDLRQRNSELEIADAREATREIALQLRPYLVLFKQQPPNWYHPYFPSEYWQSDYVEKTFQADKEWSNHVGELLSQINTLSADNRRTLEEAARLQSPTANDTPLLVRTREVIASQPHAVRQNLFQIQQAELGQLRRWIDFVLGVGVHEYLEISKHTRDIQEKMPEEEDEEGDC
jgi:hypothetical protein